MARSIWSVCIALCCVLCLSACAGSRQAAAVSPAPAPAAPELPQVLPLEPGPTPDGWTFAGLTGPVVAFVNTDLRAKVQFSFFPAAASTPEAYVRLVISRFAGSPVRFGEIAVSADGTEASVSLTMPAAGDEPAKAGKLAVRSFPGRTAYSAALLGLWPAERDLELQPVFETFKSWMRLK